MSAFRDNMTDKMLEVLNDFESLEEELKKECLYCRRKLIEANLAEDIKLPHTTERGTPVKFGAKLEMIKIGDYWFKRLQLASSRVPSEFIQKYELWDRNAGLS